MQSVQLEFAEPHNAPTPQPVDPPDYDDAVQDKVNLVEPKDEPKSDLPQLDIRINFMEDADKDTAL